MKDIIQITKPNNGKCKIYFDERLVALVYHTTTSWCAEIHKPYCNMPSRYELMYADTRDGLIDNILEKVWTIK
jgi:hypothetical protein